MALSKVSVIWSCSYFGEIPHQGCWLSVKEQTHSDVCTEGTAAHCARGGAFKNSSSSMEQDGQMIKSWHPTNICKSAVSETWNATNSPRGSEGTHQWGSDRWSIFSYPSANEKRVMGITDNPDDTQFKTQYYPFPHHVEDESFVTLGSLSSLSWSSRGQWRLPTLGTKARDKQLP